MLKSGALLAKSDNSFSSSDLASFESSILSSMSDSFGLSELNSSKVHAAVNSPSSFFKVTLNSVRSVISPSGVTSKSNVCFPEGSQLTFEIFVIE